MRGIVVAIDFSPVCDRLVEEVARLAQSRGCYVWLVHVAPPDPDFVGYDVGPQDVRDRLAEELRDEHRRLQAMADALRARGIEATALLVQGPTVRTILDEAEKLDADLIALGSHGRGLAMRALLGSVSEGVLRRAKVPVLIVPARDAEDD
jgi:nucleotide-binding universal stress UspA family protein